MLNLTDGAILYHGSYAEISCVDLNKCSIGKDFGQGFYLTTSYEQAKNFVPLSVKKQILTGDLNSNIFFGYVNLFKFHQTENTQAFFFDKAGVDWLHFVSSNRDKDIFTDVNEFYSKFDIIGGKIANDKTARTLAAYLDGVFGEPGTKRADDFAIETLLPNKLENQFCFRTNKSISCLTFLKSEKYDV